MDFVKLSVIAIIAALLALNFKSIKGEYGIFISIGACTLIFLYGISKLSIVVDSLKYVAEFINMDNSYIALIFKIIGITYISEFATDISKDCGYGTLGNQIQIFGKLTTLAISMPVLTSIVKSIVEIMAG
ncbi:MAG: stage III sporulation AC/AD family protein [Lachnospiraceae bacterium]|nr:stage III sporulation AC/AD family protein [Lachnospiraceae bacterium]